MNLNKGSLRKLLAFGREGSGKMSSTDKQGDVTTQSKEVQDKEKNHGDAKSDTSPLKRSAAELNNTDDEVKQKVLKTSHKEDKENGESEEKYDDDGEDEDDVVPDDYDEEAEDGEGDEDGADDDEDEEEDA